MGICAAQLVLSLWSGADTGPKTTVAHRGYGRQLGDTHARRMLRCLDRAATFQDADCSAAT